MPPTLGAPYMCIPAMNPFGTATNSLTGPESSTQLKTNELLPLVALDLGPRESKRSLPKETVRAIPGTKAL